MVGKKVSEKKILAGSTLGYFDVSALYSGKYILKILTGNYPSEIIEDECGQQQLYVY